MTLFADVLRSLTSGTFVLLGGCGPDDSSVLGASFPPYRYKLAAEVQTPDGIRSGQSVVEVQWHVGSGLLQTMQSAGFSFKGEAVAIDLPRDQTLFILLRTKASVDWPAYALRGVVNDYTDAADAPRTPYPLPRTVRIGNDLLDNFPMFVRFRDIRNPATVEEVDPDTLARSFGPGTSLHKLTVQVTDEPVSSGIQGRFPWWKTYLDRYFDGTSTVSEDMRAKEMAAHLTSGSFSTEFQR